MSKFETLADNDFELSTEIDAVRLLLKNEEFTATYSRHISPSLFREQLRPIVEIALKHWQQYGKLVPNMVLVQDLAFKIGTGFTDEKFKAALLTIQQLTVDPVAPKYTEQKIADFVTFQRNQNAIIASLKILEKAAKDRDASLLKQIPDLIVKANEQLNISKPSYFLEGIDARTDFRNKVALGEIDNTGYGTGIPDLDKLCIPTGGLRPGELGVFIGTTGRGKSIALLHAGLSSALKGYRVVYFTLELSESTLLDRADSSFTKTQIAEIIDEREQIRSYISNILTDMSVNMAEIAFKYLNAGSTVFDLKNELTKMAQQDEFEPLVIIVDYLDLLSPTAKTKVDGWKQQQIVAQELRSLGNEFGAAVWSASQGNRGAAAKNSEGEMMGDEDVAESYAKLGVTDWVITINRTKEQQEMPEPKPAWLNVVKNRNGIAGKRVGILTDFSRMSFYEGPYEPAQKIMELEQQALNSPAISKKKK